MADVVYSREKVEQCERRLESIAQLPRTTFTKKQVVEELIVPIEKALKTRSFKEVAEALEAEGLEISAGSLKQYVSKYRKANPLKADSSRRKRSSQAAVSSTGADGSEKAASSSQKSSGGKAVKPTGEKRTSSKSSNLYDDDSAFLEMSENL